MGLRIHGHYQWSYHLSLINHRGLQVISVGPELTSALALWSAEPLEEALASSCSRCPWRELSHLVKGALLPIYLSAGMLGLPEQCRRDISSNSFSSFYMENFISFLIAMVLFSPKCLLSNTVGMIDGKMLGNEISVREIAP